jgi:predicted transcriptional regulator
MNGLTERYLKQAEWARAQAEKAEATGRKVNGYTAEHLRRLEAQHREMAKMTPAEVLASIQSCIDARRKGA